MNEDNQKVIPQSTTILWVEDDRFLGDILTRKFATVGLDVTRAKNADEAMAIVEKFTPKAMVLDILLPGVNGFDLLQKMRTNPRLRAVPAIFLSNLNQPADLEKARVLGAHKFLVKAAVTLDEIVKEVSELAK